MFNFDDDIVVEFYDRVPWLLLLNFLVMFLLVLLVYYSTIFAFDITNKGVEVDIKAESQMKMHKVESSSSSNCSKISFTRTCSQHSKVNQEPTTIKGIATSSNIRRRSEREVKEIQDREKLSAATDVTQKTLSNCSFSPCLWFELVSKAFLSCLGLHSTSRDPSTNKRRNDPSDDHSDNSAGSKQHQL